MEVHQVRIYCLHHPTQGDQLGDDGPPRRPPGPPRMQGDTVGLGPGQEVTLGRAGQLGIDPPSSLVACQAVRTQGNAGRGGLAHVQDADRPTVVGFVLAGQ